MKKILNSIKHKGSRENLEEPRKGRTSTEGRGRASVDARHDNRLSSNTAPSHPAVDPNPSGAFVDASEYQDNRPHHVGSSSLGGDERYMTEPHSKRLSRDQNPAVANNSVNNNPARTSEGLNRKLPSSTPSAVVTTTTTTNVETSPRASRQIPSSTTNPGRTLDQSTRNTGTTSNLGVASNTGLGSKSVPSSTSATRSSDTTSSTLPMPSATTPISPRGAVPNKNKVLDPDVRLPDGFDIRDSEDTDKQVRYSKAVVHETVQPLRHHIVHEQIIREVHNHDVYHRILPIIDVEVLPAKHYIQDPSNPLKLLEVAEHEVPGYRGPGKHNWQIVETVSKLDGAPRGDKVGSKFTARSFAPNEGATCEWVDGEGVQRSERTWVHPPVSAPREGTLPLYMGSWPEHAIDSTGAADPGWPGMPGHTAAAGHHSKTGAVKQHNTHLTSDANGQHTAYRPTAGARSASSRSDYVRLVDHGLDGNEKRGTNGIETVNAGMSGLAV